jgi:DNA-binding MarR family transcriptional regulator
MTGPNRTLGTKLRHLIDLLDSGIAELEDAEGRGFRGRYTPVLKALIESDGVPIRVIADRAGITHSAASQTVARMVAGGFLRRIPGDDARERLIVMTPQLKAMIPSLQRRWAATNRASSVLEDEIGMALGDGIAAAIDALETRPFRDRIEDELRRDNEPNLKNKAPAS